MFPILFDRIFQRIKINNWPEIHEKSFFPEVNKNFMLLVSMLHYYHFKIHLILSYAYGWTR